MAEKEPHEEERDELSSAAIAHVAFVAICVFAVVMALLLEQHY
jgi:hypothetical protein